MSITENSYIQTGNPRKPQLLLIHGLASNKFTWEVLSQFLIDDYHMTAIDLPGHGMNSQLQTDFSYQQIVDYILYVESQLNIKFDYVAGHSYGASVATMFAYDSRSEIKKLALLDGGMVPMKLIPEMNQNNYKSKLSPPDFTSRKFDSISDFFDKNLALKDNPYSQQIKNAILSNFDHSKKPNLVPFLNRSNHLKIVDYLWNYDPENLLSKIKIPVLGLMACKFDTIIENLSYRCEYTDYMQSINSFVKINWILNTPHDLQLYAPKLVSRKLLNHFS